MAITQNGNTITWTGNVTLTNATDITTGVATLVLTPAGGVGNLPFFAAGTPGLPPVFDALNVSTLPPGSSATGSLTTISSGGAGVPSHYTLNLGIPAGVAGASLTTVQTVTLIGSASAGSFTLTYNGYTTAAINYNAAASAVSSALQALTSIGTGGVSVVGGTGGPWTVTFVNPSGVGVPLMTANSSGLTGAYVSVTGDYTLGGASDLDVVSTPLNDQYMVKWNASTSKFKYAAQPVGDTYNTTSFTTATGGGSTSYGILGSINIASQPFNWRPKVEGFASPSGTANTKIDLTVLMLTGSVSGTPTISTLLSTGVQVGYGVGTLGNIVPVQVTRAFGGSLSSFVWPNNAVSTSSFGVVPAGQQANLYLVAHQTASTTDSWTVNASSCSFTAEVKPIPCSN